LFRGDAVRLQFTFQNHPFDQTGIVKWILPPRFPGLLSRAGIEFDKPLRTRLFDSFIVDSSPNERSHWIFHILPVFVPLLFFCIHCFFAICAKQIDPNVAKGATHDLLDFAFCHRMLVSFLIAFGCVYFWIWIPTIQDASRFKRVGFPEYALSSFLGLVAWISAIFMLEFLPILLSAESETTRLASSALILLFGIAGGTFVMIRLTARHVFLGGVPLVARGTEQ
jgi:hypothetical protein